jgi:quinol monooxygenase YgiN
MAKYALWVMLKAKPGKEEEVEEFLKQGAAMSLEEPKTANWHGVKLGPGMYGVFDTFNDEEGRDAHLSGASPKTSTRLCWSWRSTRVAFVEIQERRRIERDPALSAGPIRTPNQAMPGRVLRGCAGTELPGRSGFQCHPAR